MDQDNLDDILGITRCVQCGQRLEGDIECPFCSAVSGMSPKARVPVWLLIAGYFFTAPVSFYFIMKSGRLTVLQKSLCLSGWFLWGLLVLQWI
jgi:hypothetical protein